jgi:plasmid stabilization system protein ParE
MNIKYLKIAREEFHDAIKYYETQQIGLGKNFLNDIRSSISRIKEFPNAYIVIKGHVRRCLLHKFNYSILYTIKDNYILIIAISHQHRKPDYWVDKV